MGHNVFQAFQLESVTCWEQVRVVDDLQGGGQCNYGRKFGANPHLDEGLHFTSTRHLLLAHTPCHLARISLNASNDGMGVMNFILRLISTFVIELFDDNDLFASMTALENDGDLLYWFIIDVQQSSLFEIGIPCQVCILISVSASSILECQKHTFDHLDERRRRRALGSKSNFLWDSVNSEVAC